MGQAEVLDILEEHGGFMTSREIADEVGQTQSTICRILRKLRTKNEVEFMFSIDGRVRFYKQI